MDVRLLQIGYDETQSAADRLTFVAELVERHAGADLVVLPEMWMHGAFASAGWRSAAIDLDGPEIETLADAARQARTNLLAGSFVERARAEDGAGSDVSGLWNTSVLLDRDGTVIARYRKIHRFGFGEGEAQVIEPGDEVVTADLLDGAGRRLCTVGLSTCYDLRFPELFRQLVDQGAEVFVVPAAWPLPRLAHWRALGVARAIENQAYVLQCNDGGSHAGLEMAGHSQVIDPTGNVLASVQRGTAEVSVDLDLSAVTQARREFPVLRDRRFPVAQLDRIRATK